MFFLKKGYNPLVMISPLLFQILYEAGNFPVELHHHPEKTEKTFDVNFAKYNITRSNTSDINYFYILHLDYCGSNLIEFSKTEIILCGKNQNANYVLQK